MDYNIRKIQEKDYLKVAKLYKDLRILAKQYKEPSYVEQEEGKEFKSLEKIANTVIKPKSLAKNSLFLVLEINNKISGFIYGNIELEESEIYEDLFYKTGCLQHIFIEEKYRGLGLATKLRDELFKFFKEKNIGLIEIGVNQANPSYEIYKKWGFESKFCYVGKKIN